jgi:hypothetical protein
MEPRSPSFQVTARLQGDLAERATDAAARLFHGNEAMLVREALIVYLDLRDAQGWDFDRVIQPLRERELTAVAS